MSMAENLRDIAAELNTHADSLRGMGRLPLETVADQLEELALEVSAEADEAASDNRGQ